MQTYADKMSSTPLSVILKWIWICGAAAVGLWLIICNLRFYLRLRKTRIPLRPFLGRRVFFSQEILSPCLYGLVNPAIYLSYNCSGPTRLHILTHEATHYAHRDHIWSFLRAVLLAVYWFDPFVWAAAAVSRRDCELACDEGAIKLLGENTRFDYGRTLIKMTAHRARASDLLCGATTMTSGKRGIKERITLISKRPKTLAAALTAAILISLFAVACTYTSSTEEENIPSISSSPSQNVSDDTNVQYIVDDGLDLDLVPLAWDYINSQISYIETTNPDSPPVINTARISNLEKIAEYDDILHIPVEVWLLEYRLLADNTEDIILAGGMQMDGDWLTEMSSGGQPCLVVTRGGDGVELITYTNTLSFGEDGSMERSVEIPFAQQGLFRDSYQEYADLADYSYVFVADDENFTEKDIAYRYMAAWLHHLMEVDVRCPYSITNFSIDPDNDITVWASEDGKFCFDVTFTVYPVDYEGTYFWAGNSSEGETDGSISMGRQVKLELTDGQWSCAEMGTGGMTLD